jgi:hypothetical protein
MRGKGYAGRRGSCRIQTPIGIALARTILDVAEYFNPVVLPQPAQSRNYAQGKQDIQLPIARAKVASLKPDSAHAADLIAAAINPMFPQAPGTRGVILRHSTHSFREDQRLSLSGCRAHRPLKFPSLSWMTKLSRRSVALAVVAISKSIEAQPG